MSRRRAVAGFFAGAAGSLLLVALLRPFWPGLYPDLDRLRREDPPSTALMRLRGRQALRRQKPYRPAQAWVPLARISHPLRRAVLAAEDDGFRRHGGVEWKLLWEAAKHDVRERRWARGASTVTQQVVRNLYLSPSKSPWRKAKEIALALHMDGALTKDRILEIYLNVAEWGDGVYGAEAAARRYFGKSASDVGWDEAAALAAVLPSPRRHSPVDGSRWTERRKAWVWRRLHATKFYDGPPRGGVEAAEVPAEPEDPPFEPEEDEPSEEPVPAEGEAAAEPGADADGDAPPGALDSDAEKK
jgi:monofunctional biosynthetic peptidoglycan transglycosylase